MFALTSRFDAQTLDYTDNAISFARKAMSQHPALDFLFTGHSLGAGLAAVTAAVLPGTKAVPIASPQVKDRIYSQFNMLPHQLDTSLFVFLGNQYDPVYHESRGTNGVGSCFPAVIWSSVQLQCGQTAPLPCITSSARWWPQGALLFIAPPLPPSQAAVVSLHPLSASFPSTFVT